MTAAMTYATLLTDVYGYLEVNTDTDTEFVAQLPRIIMLAEDKLARELKVLGQRVPVSGNMTAGSRVVTKPARWRHTVTFNIGTATTGETRKQLLNRQYEYLTDYWPTASSASASTLPEFWADYDFDHFLIAPTPFAAYPFELVYCAKIAPLDATTQTNWWTENAPDLLLKAVLVEASKYRKEEPLMLQTWVADYEAGKATLRMEDLIRDSERSGAKAA
jgi:hypothetical protein